MTRNQLIEICNTTVGISNAATEFAKACEAASMSEYQSKAYETSIKMLQQTIQSIHDLNKLVGRVEFQIDTDNL